MVLVWPPVSVTVSEHALVPFVFQITATVPVVDVLGVPVANAQETEAMVPVEIL